MPDRFDRQPDHSQEPSGQKLRGYSAGDAPAPSEGSPIVLIGVASVAVVTVVIAAVVYFNGLAFMAHKTSLAKDKDVENIVLQSSMQPDVIAFLSEGPRKVIKAVAAVPAATAATTNVAPTAGTSQKQPTNGGKPSSDPLAHYTGKTDDVTEKSLIELLVKHPQLTPARVQLVQIYFVRKDFGKARAMCQEGLEKSTSEADRGTFQQMLPELPAR